MWPVEASWSPGRPLGTSPTSFLLPLEGTQSQLPRPGGSAQAGVDTPTRAPRSLGQASTTASHHMVRGAESACRGSLRSVRPWPWPGWCLGGSGRSCFPWSLIRPCTRSKDQAFQFFVFILAEGGEGSGGGFKTGRKKGFLSGWHWCWQGRGLGQPWFSQQSEMWGPGPPWSPPTPGLQAPRFGPGSHGGPRRHINNGGGEGHPLGAGP